ncbi:hypothetical protein FGADI_7389 [Fusarium gaditjirri]|uniref:Uncharacterized protein n=1 Tax=Fusarium gaditjirri TaxID=282569 RepID=A0A8H4T5E9_9HYPO|nr:hypothetical protein FGADI_7389 [Fusarium gaditjirri]
MVRLKSSALKHYVASFADHTGRPATMVWNNQPRNILIPLPSLAFYFVHSEFSLDSFEKWKFLLDIREDGDPIRFEMFHIPGASEADCAQHYRDELKARGDVSEQVRQVEKAYEDWEDKEENAQYAAEQEPHGKLPGLISSQRSLNLCYHGVVFVYKDPEWKFQEQEQYIDVVEFDPALTADDYELGELERRGPQSPLKITHMSATKKSKVLRYEDQGVWFWLLDHRDYLQWLRRIEATFEAQSMGWTSWQ